ncbi:MAG TPA: carbohydrate ABC transporter permease [Treponema sp.]|nr:carbohydrate ABC transporter permease [Treponema sp.]
MHKVRKHLTNLFIYAVLVFTILISVFPILWVIFSAFKTNAQILSNPFSLPAGVDFSVFDYLFTHYRFPAYMLNSLLASISSTLISLLIFAMGAYVFAKYEFPLKDLLYTFFVITLLVPGQAKAQPFFSLVMKMNLYDSIWGVALVYLSCGLAMSMFILRSTFASIPKSFDEAAELEGGSFISIFFKINIPLAKNGLSTAGILMFLNNWNEYFFAALLTTSDKSRTLPVALQFFNESFSYDYTKLFAALTIVILPGIILYAFTQEQVQESFAATGIKG